MLSRESCLGHVGSLSAWGTTKGFGQAGHQSWWEGGKGKELLSDSSDSRDPRG